MIDNNIQRDIDDHRVISALAYFLFFLPLIFARDSSYARFHANQGLLLFIVSNVGGIILLLVPGLGWAILPLFTVAMLLFVVIGLRNGLAGERKRLPVFGQFDLLRQ